MAHTRNWDSSYEGSPAGTDTPAAVDVRNPKIDVRERAALEHFWKSSQTNDGKHLMGAAVAYLTNAAPTAQPGGSALNATVDKGRLWFHSTNGYAPYVFTGGNFVPVAQIDTNLNVAGNLTVGGSMTAAGAVQATAAHITGTSSLLGAVTVTSDLNVTGVIQNSTNTPVKILQEYGYYASTIGNDGNVYSLLNPHIPTNAGYVGIHGGWSAVASQSASIAAAKRTGATQITLYGAVMATGGGDETTRVLNSGSSTAIRITMCYPKIS